VRRSMRPLPAATSQSVLEFIDAGAPGHRSA
jgi:hypothetical protein